MVVGKYIEYKSRIIIFFFFWFVIRFGRLDFVLEFLDLSLERGLESEFESELFLGIVVRKFCRI